MNVIVDSLLINYSRQGSGKLVLLLHGWGSNMKALASVAAELTNKYEVLSVDLPGFGGSQRPQSDWELHDYAGFTAKFIQKIALRDVYAIIGHSNGGAIAIYGLANGMLHADRLVLLASAGIRQRRTYRKLLGTMLAKAGKIVTVMLPAKLRARLRQGLYSSLGSDYLAIAGMEGTFKNIVSKDIRTEAARLSLPTLLIYGQNDTATPPSYGHMLQALIKNSKLEVLENAGHFIYYDEPVKTNNLIGEFLD